MPEPVSLFDPDNEIMRAYVERFGPLPDMRAMSTEDAALVVARCEEALARGRAMSEREWGLPDDIPDRVTI